MHKKFEINQTKIKGSYQTGRNLVPHDSKSDLPLNTRNKVKLLAFHFLLSVVSSAILGTESPETFLDLLNKKSTLGVREYPLGILIFLQARNSCNTKLFDAPQTLA